MTVDVKRKIHFKPLEMGDRNLLEGHFQTHPQLFADHTPASLLAWAPVFRYELAWQEDTLLLRAQPDLDQPPHLLQPTGSFPPNLQHQLLDELFTWEKPVRLTAVSEAFLQCFPEFVSHFQVEACRDCANYLYEAQKLAQLQGRVFASKRNLIAQAERLYPWSLEALSADNAPECLSVADDIAADRSPESALTTDQEARALAWAIPRMEEIGLSGLALRSQGRLIAFSVFAPSASGAALILFERALREYKGAYQLINRETARHLQARGIQILNREEDLGDPGLRKAKLSYEPMRLEMAYVLTLKA